MDSNRLLQSRYSPRARSAGTSRSSPSAINSVTARGVRWSGAGRSTPTASIRRRKSASATAARSASLSRPTIGTGVSLGANNAFHERMFTSPYPKLAAVATSGSCANLLIGQDGERLDLAARNLRQGGGRLVAHHIDMSAHQVVDCRSDAAIGHVGDVLLQRGQQDHASKMRDRADAGAPIGGLGAVGNRVGHEVRQVGRRQRRPRHQHRRRGTGKADGLEVGERVVGQLLVEGCVGDVRADGPESDTCSRRARTLASLVNPIAPLAPLMFSTTIGCLQGDAHALRDRPRQRVARARRPGKARSA